MIYTDMQIELDEAFDYFPLSLGLCYFSEVVKCSLPVIHYKCPSHSHLLQKVSDALLGIKICTNFSSLQFTKTILEPL